MRSRRSPDVDSKLVYPFDITYIKGVSKDWDVTTGLNTKFAFEKYYFYSEC